MTAADTVERAASSSFPLGVKCNHCLRRSLLDARELRRKFSGERPLSSLRFRCERCGGRDVLLEQFWSRGSVTRFMRSDD